MKIIDTRGLRALVSQAYLTGRDGITFGLADVVAICDELELARTATKEAGDLLSECRKALEQLADPKLLDLERKRLRGEVGELLPRIAALIDEDPAAVEIGEAPKPDPTAGLVLHRGQLPEPPIQ